MDNKHLLILCWYFILKEHPLMSAYNKRWMVTDISWRCVWQN